MKAGISKKATLGIVTGLVVSVMSMGYAFAAYAPPAAQQGGQPGMQQQGGQPGMQQQGGQPGGQQGGQPGMQQQGGQAGAQQQSGGMMHKKHKSASGM